MKKIFLIISFLVLVNGCSSYSAETKYSEITPPTFSCSIQLPTDREIDIWNNYSENNHAVSKKRCKEERNYCPNEYFLILKNFAYFQKQYSRTKSSGIMREFRKIQSQFCFPKEYKSKIKKVKKKKSWLKKLTF